LQNPDEQKGDAVKTKFGVLTLWLLAAASASAFAQSTRIDEIEGVGTPNYVPVFTGSHRLGNSSIFQFDDSIGIGTTAPHGTLNVYETGTNTFVIRGTTTSTTGFVAGVVGETTSPDGFGVLGTNNTGVGVSSSLHQPKRSTF
jgi:hypothetical protein